VYVRYMMCFRNSVFYGDVGIIRVCVVGATGCTCLCIVVPLERMCYMWTESLSNELTNEHVNVFVRGMPRPTLAPRLSKLTLWS
jgi:hypothetical protein